MIWLQKRLIVAIHDRQLAEFGDSDGIRDEGMLESAIARPQQLYAYGDPPPNVPALAAILAFGLARNRPFVGGNKRTAYTACRTFIELNGLSLMAEAGEKYLTFLALAEGGMTAEELAEWLRSRMTPNSAEQLHEQKVPC